MTGPQPIPLALESGQNPDTGKNALFQPEWVSGVREQLVEWYQKNARDLPWRRDINPYRVLVSEFMLVQTTVAAVVPYYERFLKRFPDVQSLANANEDEVLKAWEGLGYYRRARQLQAAAKQIVEEHHGKIIPDMQIIQSLPGVGRYIAGAILSFAFDQRAPILEANTQRLLARLIALEEDLKRSSAQRELWRVAELLVPSRGAGAFNQAMMDLGATICTPRTPACLICPLRSLCEARRLGRQDELPLISRKPAPIPVVEACALVMNEGRLLVVQRQDKGLWSKFWEFPTINVEGGDPAGRGRSQGGNAGLAEGVEKTTGIRVEIGPEIRKVTYSVTKYRVDLRVSIARMQSGVLRPGSGFAAVRWVSVSELSQISLTSPARKLAAWLHNHPGAVAGAFDLDSR